MDDYSSENAERATAASIEVIGRHSSGLAGAVMRRMATKLLIEFARACRELWLTCAWTQILLLPSREARQSIRKAFHTRFREVTETMPLAFASYLRNYESKHLGQSVNP